MTHIKHTNPLVSVVMSAYNEERYIHQAMQSILSQTYPHFEVIVVNDASTDSTGKILDEYAQHDSRIKVIHNKHNIRMAASVNKAMKHARGEYIARMDADDICMPKRFEKQVAYLEKHPETVALGAQCRTIDENGRTTGKKVFPLSHEEVYDYIFSFVPLQQPTMMIARKRLPKNFQLHPTQCRIGEEIELLFELFKYGKVENLPDTLLKYRIHSNNTSFLNVRESFFNTFKFRIQAIFKHGYTPSFKGLVTSIAQAFAILVLPKPAIMFIYSNMRFIKKGKEKLYGAVRRFGINVAQ